MGVIWFVQLVHYPSFRVIGDASPSLFLQFHPLHSRWTTWAVAPAMLIELATALVFIVDSLRGFAAPMNWINLGLVCALWFVTFFISVPLHGRLEEGYDAVIAQRLIDTNWIRTALWTLRAGFLSVGIVWYLEYGRAVLPEIR